jgi:uncharacterized protein (DUF1501 family)
MKRRDFLRNSMYASLAAGAGMNLPLNAMAACSAVDMPRTFVNLMLYGGMDSKFMFMPAPNHLDGNYVDKIWAARANLYPTVNPPTNTYPTYTDMYNAEYLPVFYNGFEFGIYRRCGWLKSEFEAGRVAIIANTFCSKNRRHDQSQLNANIGEPVFDQLHYDRDGWGGRLVGILPGTPNTVELSHEISIFGNSTTAGERLGQVIHAQDMRNIALPNYDGGSLRSRRNILSRSLKSYYEARGAEVAGQTDSPYSLFFQHDTAFREFGDAVEARLAGCGPLPGTLSGLNLYSNHFEQQCRNLYDVCLAPDVLKARTVSMRYDGWDTHNSQSNRIGNNLEDLFGSSGGLSTTLSEIAALSTLNKPRSESLVFFLSSDFGRQLRANGDNGTDHGRGLYSLLIGEDVAGGLYGEMFPEREADPDSNGKIPLQTSGADVLGQTSTERILSEVCDWMQPNTGGTVFPGAGSAGIEMGVNLSGILPA